jgi:hypothetical protein
MDDLGEILPKINVSMIYEIIFFVRENKNNARWLQDLNLCGQAQRISNSSQ